MDMLLRHPAVLIQMHPFGHTLPGGDPSRVSKVGQIPEHLEKGLVDARHVHRARGAALHRPARVLQSLCRVEKSPICPGRVCFLVPVDQLEGGPKTDNHHEPRFLCKHGRDSAHVFFREAAAGRDDGDIE